jgi:hypothetical protein
MQQKMQFNAVTRFLMNQYLLFKVTFQVFVNIQIFIPSKTKSFVFMFLLELDIVIKFGVCYTDKYVSLNVESLQIKTIV